MKTTVVKSFDGLYLRYQEWFRGRAAERAAPWDREDFPRFQSFHEDVYDNGRVILNRMYYMIPLSPTESRSGKLEIFSFSELNLMEMDGDDIADCRTIEYRIE